MSAANKPRRVNLTITREMRIALDVLCSKSGLRPTTQATVILRQALDRTIQSAAVQMTLSQERAFRTRDEWLADQQDERLVELALGVEDGNTGEAPPT